MIVYIVQEAGQSIEFSDQVTAEGYATAHGLAAPTSEDRTLVPNIHIPDVTPRQIRQALILSGITMAQIDAALAAIPDATQRALAQITWDYSTEVQRYNPLVMQVAAVFGWTDSQVDSLFELARTL